MTAALTTLTSLLAARESAPMPCHIAGSPPVMIPTDQASRLGYMEALALADANAVYVALAADGTVAHVPMADLRVFCRAMLARSVACRIRFAQLLDDAAAGNTSNFAAGWPVPV